jgi:uncharacterized OsmC-like protein
LTSSSVTLEKSSVINRINLQNFTETVHKAREDPSKSKKVVEFEGNWDIGKNGPQFSARINTENGGEFLIQSDEPVALGGNGSAPNPVQYGLYGIAACYSAAFVKWISMEGVTINKFKVKVKADMDIAASLGIMQKRPVPFYEHIKFEIIIDSDLSMEEIEKINEITKQRCACYYCLTTSIIPEIVLTKIDQ